ncbi:MAG TPA: hypothetical protein ENJ95_13235 [Bacteroidetes bacterium]|nr:hypothetical protein [Bacteroidota bacterium]
MTNKNILTWGGLVLLTSASYFFSDSNGAKYSLYIIIILTLVKVFLVALQYMEMKKANRAWLFILAFVLVVYAGSVIALYS